MVFLAKKKLQYHHCNIVKKTNNSSKNASWKTHSTKQVEPAPVQVLVDIDQRYEPPAHPIPYQILVLYFLTQTILTRPLINFLNYKMFSLTLFISMTKFNFPIREAFLLSYNIVNSTMFMCPVRGLNLFLNINTTRLTTLICPTREKYSRLYCLLLDSAVDQKANLFKILKSTLIFNSPKHFIAYYVLHSLWVPRYLL